MNTAQAKYIVVEGPIGVGKTTLAARLAESFGSDLMLEGAEANPFLERFYREPQSVALQTQLFFLFQRTQQIQSLQQSDMFQPVRVADFIMEKDRLFARITLNDDEFKLYEQVYQHLILEVPNPDLVIYLQAPVEVLLKRISQRGRRFERHIEPEYLERLIEGYTRYFHDFAAAPLLIVNATEIDFVSNEADYQLLLAQVRKIRNGRHYFNPAPITL